MHGPIGLRNALREMTGLNRWTVDGLLLGLALLLALGLRAILAVVG